MECLRVSSTYSAVLQLLWRWRKRVGSNTGCAARAAAPAGPGQGGTPASMLKSPPEQPGRWAVRRTHPPSSTCAPYAEAQAEREHEDDCRQSAAHWAEPRNLSVGDGGVRCSPMPTYHRTRRFPPLRTAPVSVFGSIMLDSIMTRCTTILDLCKQRPRCQLPTYRGRPPPASRHPRSQARWRARAARGTVGRRRRSGLAP